MILPARLPARRRVPLPAPACQPPASSPARARLPARRRVPLRCARLPAAGGSPCAAPACRPACQSPCAAPACRPACQSPCAAPACRPACQSPCAAPACQPPAGFPACAWAARPPPPPPAPRSALRGGWAAPKVGAECNKTPSGRPCLGCPLPSRRGVPCLGFPLLSASRWRAAPPPLRVARAPSLAVKALRAPLRSALRPAPRWRAPRACGLDSQAARASGTVGGAAKMGARWG